MAGIDPAPTVAEDVDPSFVASLSDRGVGSDAADPKPEHAGGVRRARGAVPGATEGSASEPGSYRITYKISFC